MQEVCRQCGGAERNHRGDCRACVLASKAKYRANNKEKIAEASRIYRAENALEIASRNAAYMAANGDFVRRRKAEWRSKNLDKEQAQRLRWMERNGHKKREWKLANIEKCRTYAANRRAKSRSSNGRLSVGIREDLYRLQKGKCACCKRPLGEKYHLDHIMPLALGGSNTDDNMQLLTSKCNQQKHKKHPVEFMQSRGFLL